MTYYAATAFDSTRPRQLAPAPDATTLLQRSAKKYALNGKGLHCREFLAKRHQMSFLTMLQQPSEEVLEELKLPGHEYLIWGSLKSLASTIEMFGYVFLAAGWIGGIAGLLAFGVPAIFGNTTLLLMYWKFTLVWIVSFHMLYKLCGNVVKRGWVKDKNDTYFNRRTGMVTFTWKGKRVSYPFDEFDAAVQHVVGYAGNVNYHIILLHRYTSQFFRNTASCWNIWETEIEWEFMQQYMDISKPIPDIPQMEPFRDKDPVSAQWDAQHGRPKDYWKNMTIEKAEAMYKRAKDAAEYFPWGLTREQAIAQGWQPSGVGEGDWCQ
jgi:hypothetical protein